MSPFTGMPSYVHDIIDDCGARLAMDAAGRPRGGMGEALLHPWQKALVGGTTPRMAKNLSLKTRLFWCAFLNPPQAIYIRRGVLAGS